MLLFLMTVIKTGKPFPSKQNQRSDLKEWLCMWALKKYCNAQIH